jgi:hypothetical protein
VGSPDGTQATDPAEQSKHLRSASPVRSIFVTERHRTSRPKAAVEKNRARNDQAGSYRAPADWQASDVSSLYSITLSLRANNLALAQSYTSSAPVFADKFDARLLQCITDCTFISSS